MPYNTKNRYEQGQALRKEIYMYIVSYIKLVGYAPSITEISERVDAGRATVWKHINNLVDDGFAQDEPPQYRQGIYSSWVRNKKDKQGDKMKLYDIVAADGEFVESLTQREIMNKFGLTKCRFRTFLDNSYLIDGKYWIDDSAEDMQVTRNGCRKMLKQFDALTENIRRFVGWEA